MTCVSYYVSIEMCSLKQKSDVSKLLCQYRDVLTEAEE